MKRMTKEELIEYFMEQLQDNEVFGQVMTIDQIRKKLNECQRGRGILTQLLIASHCTKLYKLCKIWYN